MKVYDIDRRGLDTGENDMKNFMILGDSYSTFEGCVPQGFAVYYCTEGREGIEATKMNKEETWWMRLIAKTGANLVLNNSWSGSTIGYTSYEGRDVSMSASYIYRFRQLIRQGFFAKNEIDTLFVFGGTNDSWSDAPLGEVKYEGFVEKDFYTVLPSICYLMKTIKEDLPDKRIVFIANCDIKEEIVTCMQDTGKRYGVEVITLHNIEKLSGHPNPIGMEQIAEQVYAAL